MMGCMEIVLVLLLVTVVGSAAAFAAVELTRRRYATSDQAAAAAAGGVDDALQTAVATALAELRSQSAAERDAAVHAALQQAAVLQREQLGATAQQVFTEMFETGKAPAAIVEEKGLAQVSDTGAIEALCDEAIAANPGPAADFNSESCQSSR